MSDKQAVDVTKKLNLLKARFKEKALGDIQSVLAALLSASSGEGEADELRQAYQTLHRLAGSAGTFGFHALGDEARELELTCKPYADGDAFAVEPELVAVEKLLDDRVVARVRRLENLLNMEEKSPGASEGSPPKSIETSEQPVVLIIEPDEKTGALLAAALAPHGFTVHCATSPGLAPQNLSGISIILVRDRVPTLPEQLPGIAADFPPVICIGSQDTFDDRYRLASLGADGFVTEPIDVPGLADYMERLVNERLESGSGRVMIVDDDPELLEHYSVVLEEGGLEVWKVNSPSAILGALSEFRPDIVLMDVQMGPFNGPTLARMLRFDPEWTGLHIIFLSSEEDREFQFDALSQGGDDFLIKPVSDKILVRAAKVRCYRAKQLDKLASRDSLTGLLKHSLANSEIAKEHARCQRLGQHSVVVMLDLDHFKQVNDRHGHRVGDFVIKSLSNLLRHHLRKTDVIGRYGGEEFIVAMPDCSIEDARQSMQEVCDQMSRIAFSSGMGEFFVTVSIGLAPLNEFESAEEAIEAADRALYGRKSAGRDGVMAFGDPEGILDEPQHL